MEKINIEGKEFILKKETLFLGRKKINKKIATKNLIDFKNIMTKNKVAFLLGYGTLLGAIREHDFISHDEDIDILMLEEDKVEFFNVLIELQKIGFNLCRYDKRGLLSIMREGEYIDLYFFHKYKNGIYKCAGEFVEKDFLYKKQKIYFLNTEFDIPKNAEELLKFWYGDNWKIPVNYSKNSNKFFSLKLAVFKEKLKGNLPKFMKNMIYFLLEKKNEKIFMKKLKRK